MTGPNTSTANPVDVPRPSGAARTVPVSETQPGDHVQLTAGCGRMRVDGLHPAWAPTLATVLVSATVDGQLRLGSLVVPHDLPVALVEAMREARVPCATCSRPCLVVFDSATSTAPSSGLCEQCTQRTTMLTDQEQAAPNAGSATARQPAGSESWEERVTAAVHEVFPMGEADTIVEAEAFGALVYRVRERCQLVNATPCDVLREIDEDDRWFAGRAGEPAAFLAAKVREL